MNWYKKIVLADLPIYKLKEFLEKLQKEYGLRWIRNGKGADKVWGIPGTNLQTVIPGGAISKMVNPVTYKKILRNLQIPLSDFKKKQFKKKDIIKNTLPVIEEPKEIPSWQTSEWFQQEQRDLSASNYNSFKQSQQYAPIAIVSYIPEYAELGISFNGRKKYVYPGVSPYIYEQIRNLLKYKNYRKVQEMLKNLSINDKKINNQPENKQESDENGQQMVIPFPR